MPSECGFDERELPGSRARELDGEAGVLRRLEPLAQRPCAREVELDRFRNRDDEAPRAAEGLCGEFGINGGKIGAAPASG